MKSTSIDKMNSAEQTCKLLASLVSRKLVRVVRLLFCCSNGAQNLHCFLMYQRSQSLSHTFLDKTINKPLLHLFSS